MLRHGHQMMVVVGLLVGLVLPSLVHSVSVFDRKKLSPCKFNPLCLCSSSGEDLGAVECSGIPLADIPNELEDSRVFALTLVDNGLRQLEEGKLKNMGCWSLEISGNSLTSLPPGAFSGLERSVWRVILARNQFSEIPHHSIQILHKLYYLDLSDNRISELDGDQVAKLSTSLHTLILAGNSLTSVPEGIFWNLNHLVKLDLSRNNIINIHSMAFQTGLPALSYLDLADNLLSKVPYLAISSIPALKTLDLSRNLIEDLPDTFSKSQLKLDSLLLDGNQVRVLPRHAFANFVWVNLTSLAGNPLHTIEAEAFLGTGIRNLDFHNCHLSNIQNNAFRGLERSLQFLNLRGNRLSVLPPNLLDDFDSVKKLDLGLNMLAISPNHTFSGFRFSLLSADLSGEGMRYVSMRELGLIRNLKRVALPTIRDWRWDYGNLMLSQFEDFPPGLEELLLVNSNIKVIRNNAFYHIPSISKLDLSGNRINKIEENAFKEIGNSLKSLIMRSSLYLTSLPNTPFQALASLTLFDLSDNYLESIPLDTLHKMKNLQYLYLQDNKIKMFQRGTFHSQANPQLQILDLSFNHVQKIEYDTFRFPALERLHLDNNRIQTLDHRCFVEMKNLKSLTLEGNRIRELKDETFQNLHSLELLSLAYNHLTSINFEALDYVGSLSFLRLDLSHNRIAALQSNKSGRYLLNSNIRSLDLSYNNITDIEDGFFDPINSLVKILDLSHNKLTRVVGESLANLRKLASLDLSNNKIESLGERTLEASKKLQRLNLANNRIAELGPQTFRTLEDLQILDLSSNLITNMEEILLENTRIQILHLSHNRLNEIPVKALNPVQSSLRQLYLAHNHITVLSESQLGQIQQLTLLDLSHNNIQNIDSRALCCSPSLLHLSLASNPLQVISPEILTPLMQKLEHLDLSNTSLTILPSMHLPKLLHLNMSHNKLTFVPSSSLVNMSRVRVLDLSHNSMLSPPHNVWHSLPRLSHLCLAHNPIQGLKNESFLSLDRLEQLDITGLGIAGMEEGTLGTMQNLRDLRISIGGEKGFNLATKLTNNVALRSLSLSLEGGDLRDELASPLPAKLAGISVTAGELTKVHPAAFKFVTSRVLDLRFVSDKTVLDKDIFLNLGHTHNLTLDVATALGNSSVDPSVMLWNPSSSYSLDTPYSVFLTSLSLGNKLYSCNCDNMGWLVKWARKWRGEFCSPPDTLDSHCQAAIRSLRSARCEDSPEGLLDRLLSLDCLSYGGVGRSSLPSQLLVILLPLASYILRPLSLNS